MTHFERLVLQNAIRPRIQVLFDHSDYGMPHVTDEIQTLQRLLRELVNPDAPGLPNDWRCPVCATPRASLDGDRVECDRGHISS
jgi:hypothetical protein